MCHFCHQLKISPSAPAHRSANCYDRANTYSQIPMTKRRFNNGKPIVIAGIIIVRTIAISSKK